MRKELSNAGHKTSMKNKKSALITPVKGHTTVAPKVGGNAPKFTRGGKGKHLA